MSMSAFPQHEVGGTPAVLDSQQAVLLELLGAAGEEPVSYGELQEAGIELPASVVSTLELAGVPIVLCFLGEARGVGVRLERPFDARCILARTAEAASSPAANPGAGERSRDRVSSVVGGVVGRGWAAVAALIAWAICVGPPAARYAVRWLLLTSRAASGQVRRRAQHALSASVHRAREAVMAVAAWLARVVPPAKHATIGWLSQVAHGARERARSGAAHAERRGRTARVAIARTAAGMPPGIRAGLRWLTGTSHDLAEWLRSSIANTRAARQVSRGNPIQHPRRASSTAYPPGPPLDAAAPLRPPASQQTRNRCLAFSALVAVSGVVLAVVLSNLGASAGGARRLATHRHHSRLAQPNAAPRAPAVRTSGTTK